jgi:zinc D-Ala-D-Ala carboxypeptidase
MTKKFTLNEFIESPTARQRGILEQFTPSKEVQDNLKGLCENVLQPLRDSIGRPLKITSGYRSPALNAAIRGSKNSDHMRGEAADIQLIVNGANHSGVLFNKIIELKLPFNQMIWEFGDRTNPQWVHISFKKTGNKREILYARKINGKTAYSKT